jgi:hypothetical protein
VNLAKLGSTKSTMDRGDISEEVFEGRDSDRGHASISCLVSRTSCSKIVLIPVITVANQVGCTCRLRLDSIVARSCT